MNKRCLLNILDNERHMDRYWGCVYIYKYIKIFTVTKEIAVQVGFLLPFLEYVVSTESVSATHLPLQPPHTRTRGTKPATFRLQNKRSPFS